jgi:hypothetical protein
MSASPVRVCFDTTVLWGAFHSPAGPNFRLLELAAQRTPVLYGFFTDAVGAEFWWRATQQGVAGPGQPIPRTYSEAELAPFFETFDVLFEPSQIPRAPLSRSLGRYAGMVVTSLGEVLAKITGKDRDALITGMTMAFPMTFETIDTADLHVIAGAIANDADQLISNDRRTLDLDPIGSMRVRTARALAEELGLITPTTTAARQRR